MAFAIDAHADAGNDRHAFATPAPAFTPATASDRRVIRLAPPAGARFRA